MEENKVDVVLTKKLDGYRTDNMNNYTAPGEITVTITLNEYRDLVEKNATASADISKANSDKYKLQNEITALKKEADDLRKRLFDILDGNNASEPKADETRCV